MTNAVLFFLAVSNILAWFVIGRHSSTLGAFRRNNIRVWKTLDAAEKTMKQLMESVKILSKWNCHQDRVMVETLHGLMTTTGAEGTKKKGSQKVKITRK